MAETKDKLVTVESIEALHKYNERRTKMGYSDTAMESYIDTNVVAGPDGSTLLPNVSIVAKDKNNDSIASINVTDFSSMGDGNSGYITLNASNTDIYSDEFVVNNEDEDYKIRAYVGDSRSEIELRAGVIGVTGDITAFDNLTVLKTFSAMDNILCYKDIDCSGNIKSGGYINCVDINCEDTVSCDNVTFGDVGAVNGTISEGEYANVIRWSNSIKHGNSIDIRDIGVSVGSTGFPTWIYGNRISINTGESPHPYKSEVNFPGLSNREYGVPSLLWSSATDRPRWMGTIYGTNTAVTIDLSESVGNQPNGIVLVFSSYNPDVTSETAPTADNVEDINFHSFFVPKAHILTHRSYGNSFIMQKGGMFYHKFLYIGATQITGHATNMNTAATLHGQKVNNRNFVLREVWGV